MKKIKGKHELRHGNNYVKLKQTWRKNENTQNVKLMQ